MPADLFRDYWPTILMDLPRLSVWVLNLPEEARFVDCVVVVVFSGSKSPP